MTKKQKKTYLKNPNKCPYCESENIIRQLPKMYDGILTGQTECFDCESIWEDIYKVFNVEEILEVK